ncbi:unnamed protein product [Penicillium salamii]|nr:unnamed protein product [Penicillium salamii]
MDTVDKRLRALLRGLSPEKDSAAKRLRSNTLGHAETTGAEAPSTQTAAEKATELVDKIGAQEVSKILIQAAQAHPDVMAMLDDSFRAMVERERARVITFDHYSGSIWRDINVSYSHIRGYKLCNKAFDVSSDMSETIQSIARQCGPNANPQTRYNGLSVLRKIGKTIALSEGDNMALEVQQYFQSDDTLVEGMASIIESMGEDELNSIANQKDTENLYLNLLELVELSEGRHLFEGLSDVPKYLSKYKGDEEEEGEGEREGEEARVITFDHYSSSIWREINVSYRSMRGSAQYEQAFEVASDTSSTIQSIARQCGSNANPQTRYNGLSVLRKIGKTICLSGGNTIAHEVQKHFQSDDALVKGMIRIINSMGHDELESIANQEDTEKLYPKLVELDQLSEDRCLFEGIQDVPWNVGGYAADREEKGYGKIEEAEQEKAEPEVIVIE